MKVGPRKLPQPPPSPGQPSPVAFVSLPFCFETLPWETGPFRLRAKAFTFQGVTTTWNKLFREFAGSASENGMFQPEVPEGLNATARGRARAQGPAKPRLPRRPSAPFRHCFYGLVVLELPPPTLPPPAAIKVGLRGEISIRTLCFRSF